MRLDSVLDFLQMDFLDVSEPDLTRALIKWGRAHINQDGEDSNYWQKLRAKILPCLKLINFLAMSNKNFALLCLEELGQILSSHEKYLIMMCISLGDWNQMPEEITSIKKPSRQRSSCVVELRYGGPEQVNKYFDFISHVLTLSVDRKASLIGFQLVTPPKATVIENAYKSFKITITSDAGVVVGSGVSKDRFTYCGKQYFKVTSVCPMAPGVVYTLKIELSTSQSFQYTGIPYILDSSNSYKCNTNLLTLSLHNQGISQCSFAAKVTDFVFELFN